MENYIEKLTALANILTTHYARTQIFTEKSAEATWNKISDLFVPLKEDSKDDSEITKKDYDELQEFCKKLQWECATLRNKNKELKKCTNTIV